MKTLVLVLLVGWVGCTKPNPNRCCNDEADCMAAGIPVGSACGDGLLCRGNQCIAVTCSSAAECDASAPFCVDSACAEMCSADDQCPGFEGAANQTFCVSGNCAQCRVGSNDDCSGAAPVCASGVCRACKAHSECTSGVCASDGTCAAETDIAYVAPGASDVTDCSKATKCSLTHGLSLSRKYVLLSAGTFTMSSSLTLSGPVHMIGGSTPKPSLTSSVKGKIVVIAAFADVTLENLQIRGATGNGSNEPFGYGLDCPSVPAGPRHVRMIDVDVIQNQLVGVTGHSCMLDALRSTFSNNGLNGFEATDGSGTLESCSASENGSDGFFVDIGLFTIRNSFSVRNMLDGFDIDGTAGSVVEFNTAADNNRGFGCGQPFTFVNVLSVRNRAPDATSCTFTSSLLSDVSTGINFKSPDVAPYDYHIMAGSLAIDASTTSSPNDVDYDGDARPQGAAKDIGADEYKP